MPDERLHGSTKYTLRKMISFALTGVVANSIQPLRLANVLCALIAGLSVLYAVYALAIFLTASVEWSRAGHPLP